MSLRSGFLLLQQKGTLGSARLLRHRPLTHFEIRSYYYFPVSWEDFRERFNRWAETTDRRFLKVKLVARQRRQRRLNQDRRRLSRFVGRTAAKWNTWFQRQRRGAVGVPPAPSALPLPSVNITSNGAAAAAGDTSSLNARYQGWKSRRREQYQRWKRRRQEQYQSWKLKGREKYQGWKLRRKMDWIRTKQIVLNEYSRPEWFDELGRPLTSKNSIGRYVNPWQSQSTNGLHSVDTILKWRWQRFRREFSQIGGAGSMVPKISWSALSGAIDTEPKLPLPLPEINSEALSATWVGHSTCWIQINGFTVLTDPIFSLRSSPFQSLPIGVARDIPPSHSIRQLVEHGNGKIDFCCITHDHYDHMDRCSVEQLVPYVGKWMVPLGIGDWLVEKCGVAKAAVVELGWWQQAIFGRQNHGDLSLEMEDSSDYINKSSLTITLTPAQHWSSRTIGDRNLRLWGSFAITSPQHRVFFCGDTGYPRSFPLFRQIADTLGPFDLACIPIGAYTPSDLNREAHVSPMEAVQIHKDLMSRHSIAIHWGSFALGEEDMSEPPQALLAAMRSERTILPAFEALEHGGTIQINQSTTTVESSIESEHDASAGLRC